MPGLIPVEAGGHTIIIVIVEITESIEVFLTQVEEQDQVMSQRLRAFLWRLDKNLEKENFSNDPPTKWMVRHTLLQDRFRKLVNGLDRRPANISIAKTEDHP